MSKIKTNNNIPISSLGQAWQKGKVLALSVLLLFSTQALVSAKTLLEKYLNCDGIEEFAYRKEMVGYPDNIREKYVTGRYQDGNFLIISSQNKMELDNIKVDQESSFTAIIHFGTDWRIVRWHPRSGESNYCGLRDVWTDKNREDEKDNSVYAEGTGALSSLANRLLNYGIRYSVSRDMQLDSGQYEYENIQQKGLLEYSVLEKDGEMPKTIQVKYSSIGDSPKVFYWITRIEYTIYDHQKIPRSITLCMVKEDGSEVPFERVDIEKLVLGKRKLTCEDFLLPELEKDWGITEDGNPSTYYVRGDQMVGVGPNSKEVVRLKPDDPRILRLPAEEDKKSFTLGYWIGGILLLGAVLGSFLAAKRSKHEADINNNK